MAEKKTGKTGTRKVISKASPGAAAETAAKKAAPILGVDQLEREIRAEAQKVYENRRAKGLPGDELSDWLEAEIVIKKKYRL
jgi:hypothetical protein